MPSTPNPQVWRFPCLIEKVVDGDTVDIAVHLGFRLTKRTRMRLLGINAPEMKGATLDAGRASQLGLLKLLTEYPYLHVETHKDKFDNFGRYLAELHSENAAGDECNINERMVELGLAVRDVR